jgi:nucleotide-binding universal stress UspA family protein
LTDAVRKGEPAVTPIRTVLHPTDFSAPSEAALEIACSIARGHAARLVILHVAPCEVAAEGMIAIPADLAAYRRGLNDLRARIVGPDPGFPVETCLREGLPDEEVLRAVDDLGADLVVMGTHGRTGLARLVMGSVAEAVSRRAGCPVLLTRGSALAPPTPDTGRAKVDRDGVAVAAGRVILTEGRCGCGTHSVHAIHRDFPEYWAEGGSPAEGATSLEAKLTQARESCCPGDWHYNDLTQAIDEVRAFRDTLSTPAET